MARDVYRGVNESLYTCSLEELGRRNRLIMIMFANREWAEGDWSIRVFSDGGFNQIGRLDFVITDNKFSDSAKKIQSAVKDSSESGSTNFWDTVG